MSDVFGEVHIGYVELDSSPEEDPLGNCNNTSESEDLELNNPLTNAEE